MTEDKEYSPEDRRLDRLLDVLEAPPPSDLLRARVKKGLAARTAGAPSRAARAERSGSMARAVAAIVLAAAVAVGSWMPPPGGSGPDGGTPTVSIVAGGALPDAAQEEGADNVALVGAGETFNGVSLVRAAWDEPAAAATTSALATEDDLALIPLD